MRLDGITAPKGTRLLLFSYKTTTIMHSHIYECTHGMASLGKQFLSLGTSQEQTAWLRKVDVGVVKSFSSSAEEAAIAA